MTKDNQNDVDAENALKSLKPSFQNKQCKNNQPTKTPEVFFSTLEEEVKEKCQRWECKNGRKIMWSGKERLAFSPF